MGSFESYFTHHEFGFWVALALVVLGIVVWLVVSDVRRQRIRSHNEEVLRSVESGNVPAMLAEYLTTVRSVAIQSADVNHRVATLDSLVPGMIRHVGLVRFSPFHDTGSDQSFSLALLDGEGNGVVVSALHARTGHKLYAKPVVNGSSTYPLTDEERRAISERVRDSVEATSS
jgi:hypothetical protein